MIGMGNPYRIPELPWVMVGTGRRRPGKSSIREHFIGDNPRAKSLQESRSSTAEPPLPKEHLEFVLSLAMKMGRYDETNISMNCERFLRNELTGTPGHCLWHRDKETHPMSWYMLTPLSISMGNAYKDSFIENGSQRRRKLWPKQMGLTTVTKKYSRKNTETIQNVKRGKFKRIQR